MSRRSDIRQTRSQARALREQQINLQGGMEQSTHSSAENRNVAAATVRADAFDCGKCDRLNNAEPMISCQDCRVYYHLSCANATAETVQGRPFVCSSCARLPFLPPARSMSGRWSSSSARQARIARELQRLEEERQLEEEIQREQIEQEKSLAERSRREKLERQRQFIARKYDLLSQADADEDDGSNSGSDNRNSRVESWVRAQGAAVAGPSEVVVNVTDSIQRPSDSSAGNIPAVNLQSTPLTQKKATGANTNHAPSLADQLAAAIDVETTGSITIGDTVDDEEEGAVGIDGTLSRRSAYHPISPVNTRMYDQVLEEPNPVKPTTGAVPKVVRSTTLFERWRSETASLRKCTDLESEHRKENDLRRKRELELTNQLKQMEIQRRDEQQIRRAMEEEFQQRERDQALIEERKQRELAAVQDELHRLREIEQQFLKQREQQPTSVRIVCLFRCHRAVDASASPTDGTSCGVSDTR
ncbi:uncharacterized protein LOC134290203 [Aedes albopictus]|uniref:Zinc finger PHD-type domain-containing protein n=1 Tax=Aedes albopictus TaxID=7160 RepID=A0ABM1ZD95_AEDAL